MDLARARPLGQRQQPSPEGPVPAADGVHCLGFQWGYAQDRKVPCLPGLYHYGNPGKRIHLTEKPLQLMRDIVHITEPGGHILDPFAGAGTTVLGAVLEGYSATGIEFSKVYAEKARERIEQALSV